MLPQIALGQSQSSILANAYFENDLLDLVHVFVPPLMSSTMNAEAIAQTASGGSATKTSEENGKEGGRPEKPDDEKSEKTFTDWLNVLERTKDGESFAVINDENKANVLRQIEGTIKTKGLNKEEAQKFVYNMVSNGICDQDTYNAVVTSNEFK